MTSSTRLRQISRDAAVKLVLSAAGAIGLGFLLAQAAVWNAPREMEPFYRTLPGVDLGGLSLPEVQPVLRRLNLQRCPCDCARTVASCRNHHDTCSLSLALARAAVAQARIGSP